MGNEPIAAAVFGGLACHSSGSNLLNGQNGKTTDSVKLVGRYEAKSISQERRDRHPWVMMPEIPSATEILAQEDPKLKNNPVHEPWQSKEAFLEAHYRLLRENSVRPLREAVKSFRAHPNMDAGRDFNVYDNVNVIGLTFTDIGIATKVNFSSARSGKRIIWTHSKRLTPGTLLAMSTVKDKFKTHCKVVVVASRSGMMEVWPPEVDLFFADPQEATIDPQQRYILLEARMGYFEASRHTLLALQRMVDEDLPLSEKLLKFDTQKRPPAFRLKKPVMDLRCVLPKDCGKEARQILQGFNVLDEWDLPSTTLDSSQLAALESMMTDDLSMIVGPPGCGKTHLSALFLEALAANMREGDPPIIVTTQTNHALDQVLRQVSRFEPNFVRLGARTADKDVVEPRTLHTLRGTIDYRKNHKGGGKKMAKDLLTSVCEKIKSLLHRNFWSSEPGEEPLSASFFASLGLLTAEQAQSLGEGTYSCKPGVPQATDEVADCAVGPMATWLGPDLFRLSTAQIPSDADLEPEDADPEFEQLAEIFGLTDDGEKPLGGPFIGLAEPFITRRNATVRKQDVMTTLTSYNNLWDVPDRMRGSVYRYLQERAKKAIIEKYCGLVGEYDEAVKRLRVSKWEQDHRILKTARIIGLTTTGLAKYRGLIASIEPHILLVEEAAEVTEGHVVAGFLESFQQIILVGDHLQLRPHCDVRELEGEPYNLEISMFERLVSNDVPFTSLTSQRRMIPELRSMISSFYVNLEDHPTVLRRPSIPGMGGINSYIFTHNWHESRDNVASFCNELEAVMLVGFYEYLCMNHVPAEKITVLCFYHGQRKLILSMLRGRAILAGKRFTVVTVDSYQGEENDVVLLSMTRSNRNGNVGFLTSPNRSIVALSRARNGFYAFGNFDTIASASSTWWDVVEAVKKELPDHIGSALPIVCSKHGSKNWIRYPHDWKNVNGGCAERCCEILPCGHECPLRCHPFPESKVMCQKPCPRKLPCGCECTRPCWDKECRCSKRDVYHSMRSSPHPNTTSAGLPLGSTRPSGAIQDTTVWHKLAVKLQKLHTEDQQRSLADCDKIRTTLRAEQKAELRVGTLIPGLDDNDNSGDLGKGEGQRADADDRRPPFLLGPDSDNGLPMAPEPIQFGSQHVYKEEFGDLLEMDLNDSTVHSPIPQKIPQPPKPAKLGGYHKFFSVD